MLDFLIHSPIAFFGRETPEHPALACAGVSMTYAALDAKSNQLAHALIQNGIKPQDRVGIFMHKGLPLGVAIYGILKAGGVFVPLDPLLPIDRLRFILTDCGISNLVSGDSNARALRELGASCSLDLTVFGVDADLPYSSVPWTAVESHAQTPPEVWMTDQDLGYIMYTSGSTGAPKGMMHTHAGSNSYARWGALHVDLTSEDRVASHAPLHFDLSIFDFFSTAQVGGTVVLVPEPITKFPASWTQQIDDERISVVFTVPFTLIEMLQRGAMEQRSLASLRWILFGGEPFPPKHLRALMLALPGTRFTNVYGPAEAPSCTCYDLPGPPVDDDTPIPIGTVSRNSRDIIVDADGVECPDGEAGELCIRSSTLTRGYWNRPDLNRVAFLTRPTLGPFPDVYYRTGDIVIRHADGLLRFLGRRDRMVKVRGYRIELDDVEAALASHPAVSEAAAFTVPDERGSKKILAVVTLHDGAESGPADIIRHARTKIPGYAIPDRTTITTVLPRTTSGKIDRKHLASTHTTTS